MTQLKQSVIYEKINKNAKNDYFIDNNNQQSFSLFFSFLLFIGNMMLRALTLFQRKMLSCSNWQKVYKSDTDKQS